MELRLFTVNRDVSLFITDDRNITVRKFSDDIGEESGINSSMSLAVMVILGVEASIRMQYRISMDVLEGTALLTILMELIKSFL